MSSAQSNAAVLGAAQSAFLPDAIARQWPEDAPALREGLGELFPPIAGAPRSRLTRSGHPLEYAFVWPEGRPRFTVDMDPEATGEDRRKRSVEQLGFEDNSIARRIAGWTIGQSGWGAWVGARNRGGRPSYKIYLEIANEAPWRELETELGLSCSSQTGGTMCMAGVDSAGDRENVPVELYYRLLRLYSDQIPGLLTDHGLPDRSRELIDRLERLIGRSVRNGIPSANLGCSYAVSGGAVQAFTLYSYATSLLGPDDRVRDGVLRFCSEEGWDASAYEELTLPYVSERRHWSAHGMVGFVLDAGGKVHFTIGISTGRSS